METIKQNAPLAGIRILDLSTMLAGPFGTMMLGDLGAEIIKIETMDGDNTRNFPPYYHKGTSLYYLSFNRNKKSMVIDLKSQKGLEIFYRLVESADVVWENYRDGVAKRLKVDYETLKKINPSIIYCSITAYGQDNPFGSSEPTYDLCIQAMSGVLSMTGEKDRPPVKLGVPMADIGGGWYGVVGVLAALIEKKATNRGQKVDISMLDALASLNCYEGTNYLYSKKVPERLGTAHRSLVPYQIFQTQDIYIAIVVASDKFWGKLCVALNRLDYITDERFADLKSRHANRELVYQWLEQTLIEKPSDEWLKILKKEGVPCAPVNPMDKALQEPALLQREMIVEIDHKGEAVQLIGNPIKLSNNQPQRYDCPPELGENTRQVLSEILELTDDEIDSLIAARAVLAYEEQENDRA